jgi:hypothetical protein
MSTQPMPLTTVIAALVLVSSAALAAPVVTDQSVMGEEFQLNGMDYINVISVPVDGDTAQGDPDGVNEESGDHNVQENKSVVVPDADSLLRQNLTGNSFNTAPTDDPIMHNSVDFSLTADGPITQDIGVNAAAGAFNLQANSSVVAAGIGLLGESTADARQDTLSSASVLQDATNEVMSVIDLEDVVMSASTWCRVSATSNSTPSQPQPPSLPERASAVIRAIKTEAS